MPLVRRISVIIAIVAGLAVLLDFFIEQEAIDSLGRVVVDWVMILAAVAIVLGLLNLASVHTGRIASTHPSWPYSLALLAALLVTVLIGFAPGNSGANDPALNWLFSYIYQPLAAAVLSLLAFYIASAAYRTLRLRTWEAAGLMIAAMIVLLGQIPLAAQIGDIFPQARDLAAVRCEHRWPARHSHCRCTGRDSDRLAHRPGPRPPLPGQGQLGESLGRLLSSLQYCEPRG